MEEIYKRIRKINEDALAKNATDGSIYQKIGDFWFSGMDTVNIEKQGLSPLKPDFDSISAIQSVEDLVNVAAELHNKGINVLFLDQVGQDDKNSTKMIYWLWQGGLLLPNRDYYFNTDKGTIDTTEGLPGLSRKNIEASYN
jgi:putative endopeptidase